MEFLQNLLDNSQLPVFTAFLLGLLTAVSPCPLATNITAVGFISKGIESRNRVLWCGVLYSLGRVFAYTMLGAILIYILRKGADTFDIQQSVSEYGELILGPALLIIGVLMFVAEFVDLGAKFGFQGGSWAEKQNGYIGSFILGVLFAMAFCPSSGLFYFGMLIPMSAEATASYLLPLVFAIATALPVLVVSWLLAYSVQSLGKFLGKMKIFQKWFSRIVAVLFIVVGVNYCYKFIL